ncbi:MAG: DUF4347 domain-containing protein [Armatimonadetes bacterium]|nr:DUF4347 domain-containing protein [Armatimonadota bacterium]
MSTTPAIGPTCTTVPLRPTSDAPATRPASDPAPIRHYAARAAADAGALRGHACPAPSEVLRLLQDLSNLSPLEQLPPEQLALLADAVECLPGFVSDGVARLLTNLAAANPAAFPELVRGNHPPGSRVIVSSSGDDPAMRLQRWFAHRARVNHGRSVVNASSLREAVQGILAGAPAGRGLEEITFYAHGRPGAISIGNDEITVESLRPGHPRYDLLVSLRNRLGPNAVIYLRACECFRDGDGRAFGQALADFFGRRVVGHTQVMGGPWRPGEVSFQPAAR